jgi:hypothetical protein
MAIDIEVVERTIKASIEEALKRMRKADEKLTRAQQGGRGRERELAEASNEYNRCVAELADYLNVSSRHRDSGAEGEEA